jgi:hypothetical protein
LRVKQLIHNLLFIQFGIGMLSKALFQSTPRGKPVSQALG